MKYFLLTVVTVLSVTESINSETTRNAFQSKKQVKYMQQNMKEEGSRGIIHESAVEGDDRSDCDKGEWWKC